jgi:hypothetical protein
MAGSGVFLARAASRSLAVAFALFAFFAFFALACSGGNRVETIASASAAIVNGTPATSYPEAVYVTTQGFLPCSGVLLTPSVVLSAGHCQGTVKSYVVNAPNAGNQTSTSSRSWSPFEGNAATTSDVMLIFLDTPITIATYPTLSAETVASGTSVVDLGRTLNGTIENGDYVSPAVTIEGDAASLGFPLNYQALPDISEDGDSGGPIMLAGTHTIVAIVDTDTTEQQINEATPIDLFARIDVVKAEIDAQIATNGLDGGAEEDAGVPSNAADSGGTGKSGGCSVGVAGGANETAWWPLVALVTLLAARGRGAHARRRPEQIVEGHWSSRSALRTSWQVDGGRTRERRAGLGREAMPSHWHIACSAPPPQEIGHGPSANYPDRDRRGDGRLRLRRNDDLLLERE